MPVSTKSRARTCVSLRPDQRQALRSLARETGAPMGELVRRATDAYLVARVAGYSPAPQHPEPVPFESGSIPWAARS